MSTTFQPNERVNWQHESDRPDSAMVYGYGKGLPIPARVVKLGAKRVQIELKVRRLYVRNSLWDSKFKWVDATTLSPRVLPCAAFHEPMQHVHAGFVLTGWKHPNGRSHHPRRRNRSSDQLLESPQPLARRVHACP